MQYGFTLIELLIVIGLGISIAVLTIPIGISFYNSQALDAVSQEVLQTLRRAQIKAMSMQNDSSFGVYFEDGQYRLEDEVFVLPSSILISGASQVIFSKLEGLPSYIGNIIITNGKEIETININAVGRIQLD